MKYAKLESIIQDYRNGNLTDAARKVRSLSRIDLFDLLINDHRLTGGFFGQPAQRVAFQDFIDRALNGWFQ